MQHLFMCYEVFYLFVHLLIYLFFELNIIIFFFLLYNIVLVYERSQEYLFLSTLFELLVQYLCFTLLPQRLQCYQFQHHSPLDKLHMLIILDQIQNHSVKFLEKRIPIEILIRIAFYQLHTRLHVQKLLAISSFRLILCTNILLKFC